MYILIDINTFRIHLVLYSYCNCLSSVLVRTVEDSRGLFKDLLAVNIPERGLTHPK